jgi:membrane protein required for colicin V production
LEFNLFDAVVIVISLLLGIKGFFRGIIKELAGLIGIIGGIFFASKYYNSVGTYINENLLSIPNESAIYLVGFISVFMGVWVVVWLIGEMIAKMFKVAKLSILDKVIGAAFSSGKFFLLIAIFISMLTQIEFLKDKLETYQKDSVMYPIMLNVGNTIVKLKPEDVQKHIDDVKQKIDKNIGDNIKQNIEDVKKNITEKVSEEVNKQIDENMKK